MTHNQHNTDSVMAWITGAVGQFLVMETVGNLMVAILTAGVGGFVGYVGKELGAIFVKKYFKKTEQKSE